MSQDANPERHADDPARSLRRCKGFQLAHQVGDEGEFVHWTSWRIRLTTLGMACSTAGERAMPAPKFCASTPYTINRRGSCLNARASSIASATLRPCVELWKLVLGIG